MNQFVTSFRVSARRVAFAAVACLALAPLPSHAAAKIQHLISPGGIEAWFVQDATVPLIAMEYAFGGGATQDPADKSGVGNMVANLLDEGSGDLDSKTFHERLDRRAIELSFTSTRDYFRGSLRMLKDNRDEAFDLLRMALTSPRFETADIERVRTQVLSGLRRDTSNPSALASRKFLQVAFGDHPYARQANGSLESVPTIDTADMKDYVRRVLAKDTLRIAVVGDVDPATLGQLLDKTFGALPAKASLTPVAEVEAAKPPERAFIPLDVPQTVVTFGGPGIKRHDPNFMAGYVVNHILGGGGLSSRLYREVREKRGLAYSVNESLLWMDRSAIFIGTTGTRADRAGETVDAIETEIHRIAEEGPSQQELNEAKSYLKGSQMLAENLIGEEGKGFRYILSGMNAERILIAAECVGDAKWFIAKASAYARERAVFGRPIGQNQGIQFPIAKAYASMRAAELMVKEATRRYEAGLDCGAEANMAKMLAADASWEAANACVQTHGGFGFAEEYDIERKFRETRLYQVAPISTNLILSFLAEHVLGMPRSY